MICADKLVLPQCVRKSFESPKWLIESYQEPLLQTGSTLARTNLSPFARCTLGLNCHTPVIFSRLCDHCLHDLGLYIQKILTNREMVNFQKFDFLRFLTINSVTTGARELNGTSQKCKPILPKMYFSFCRIKIPYLKSMKLYKRA